MTTALLTAEDIEARRHAVKPTRQLTFGVTSLYGLSTSSIRMPLSETEAIESGQVCITIDPEAGPNSNVGILDFEEPKLVVRYGIQAVFPGLYELINEGQHDPALLNPVRATATDECSLTPDFTGWRALGCLDILPGSLWAGADGG